MTLEAVRRCAQIMHEAMPLMMRALFAEMRRRQPQGLSHVQVRAMMIMQDHPDCSLSLFAEEFGATLSSASKLIDGLVARGYVARQPVAGDRRRVALSLTPAGLAIFEAGHAEMLRVLTEQLSALPAEECAVVEQAFGILRAHFRHRHPELERDGA